MAVRTSSVYGIRIVLRQESLLVATRCAFVPILFALAFAFAYALFKTQEIALTCIVSPAAIRRCCPIGESVGRALVVNLLVRPALVSFAAVVVVVVVPNIPPTLRLLLFLGGESGLFE